jgi:hypothetical protein
MRARSLIVGATVLGIVAAACSSSPSKSAASSTPTATPASGRLSSPAKLSIISPTPGAVVHGTSVVIKVKLENARIVPRTTTQVTPTTGHIHIAVDGRTIALYAGAQYTVTGLTKGQHLISAEFVEANHIPFDPRIITTVTIDVQ